MRKGSIPILSILVFKTGASFYETYRVCNLNVGSGLHLYYVTLESKQTDYNLEENVQLKGRYDQFQSHRQYINLSLSSYSIGASGHI